MSPQKQDYSKEPKEIGTRNDYEPGFIYVMYAPGFHGKWPGCYLKRCKIGLSRSPTQRVENFIRNQPPCDIKILRTFKVFNMKAVESVFHYLFRNRQVKLQKSREWFDLYPWDFWRLNIYISCYQNKSGFWRFLAKIIVGV